MIRLDGRHALVTGAGSGIGAAIAAALADEGAKVTLAGRQRGPLETLAQRIGKNAHVADGFDVTDVGAIERGLGAARAAFGAIDILINNAGEAPSAPFEKTDLALWNRVLALDLTAVFQMIQAVLPDLKAHGTGARIVNVASTAGLTGYPYVAAYCAAKHGVVGLTRALALELAKTGITVNAVCPGFTDTPMLQRAIDEIAAKTGRSPAETLASFTKANPQGRLVTPQEVAESVVWLCLPNAQAINGQAIPIAGGEVLG